MRNTLLVVLGLAALVAFAAAPSALGFNSLVKNVVDSNNSNISAAALRAFSILMTNNNNLLVGKTTVSTAASGGNSVNANEDIEGEVEVAAGAAMTDTDSQLAGNTNDFTMQADPQSSSNGDTVGTSAGIENVDDTNDSNVSSTHSDTVLDNQVNNNGSLINEATVSASTTGGNSVNAYQDIEGKVKVSSGLSATLTTLVDVLNTNVKLFKWCPC
jgi:hypothetical protein